MVIIATTLCLYSALLQSCFFRCHGPKVLPRTTRNATVFSYVSLLSSFRSMLAETPAPLSVKSPSMAGVITPSKVNQSGRSAVRIQQQQQQQQQQQRQQKQGKHQVESVLDTSTPSKVAVGHDFRCLALHTAQIVHTKPVLNSTHKTRFKTEPMCRA